MNENIDVAVVKETKIMLLFKNWGKECFSLRVFNNYDVMGNKRRRGRGGEWRRKCRKFV